MKTRYSIEPRDGSYIEFEAREEAEQYRTGHPGLAYHHIREVLQSWDHVVVPGRLYPPGTDSMRDFRRFNTQHDQENEI